MRWLFLLHRYLGIAGAAFMALWCVSGLVMMFVPYPSVSETARLAGLRPLDWRNCCEAPDDLGTMPVSAATVEMLLDEPVLRFVTADGRVAWAFLAGGRRERLLSDSEARRIAQTFADRSGVAGRIVSIGTIDHDQWTVSGAFRPLRPLYRAGFDDPLRTDIYVSATDGKIVQHTTAQQRFWNWLGAVPHWLYFSALREHAALWSQVVIWTALAGCFLTVTGLWIGIRQFWGSHAGSPYRGILFWHHVPGLVFGVFALTWVFSGFLSMNPWGLLEGSAAGRKESFTATMRTVLSAMQSVRTNTDHAATVAWAPFAKGHYLVVTHLDGRRERFDSKGRVAPLSSKDFERAAGDLGSAKAQIITAGDAYYYPRHNRAMTLPVYRVIGPAPARVHYYLDAVSGQLVASLDPDTRGYRWFSTGLHTLDFTAALRSNPLWQAAVILLLLGVTALCLTGLYLAVRRLWQDARGRKPA